MKRTALIIGSRGQDGRLLSDLLLEKKYDVKGIGKEFPIHEPAAVLELVSSLQPREIYYLAAFHHSAENLPASEDEILANSMLVHHDGLLNFLQSIKKVSKDSKLFYASSSHVFGSKFEGKQNENTLLVESSPYAKSKVAGMMACQKFRNEGYFASVGILYNHESHLRNAEFVSRKISRTVALIKKNRATELILGDLDATIDWGFAGDYVKAMWSILQLDHADDFIVATGTEHSLRDFVKIAFDYVGLDYKKYVVLNEKLIKKQSARRIGDSTKLQKATGWKPVTEFKAFVELMVSQDLESLKDE
jgi:GDPmannose 4,6-dehydratase